MHVPFLYERTMNQKSFQTIQEIGAFALKERLSVFTGANVEMDSISSVEGHIDTVTQIPPDHHSVCSASRLFLEGVHFDPTYTPFALLGNKMMIAAMSPLIARRVKPTHMTVTVAVPNKYSVEMIEEFFSGADQQCKNLDLVLTCADVTASHQQFVVSVHCSGYEKILLSSDSGTNANRSTEPGDLICVTGDLGAAFAGLRILLREKKFWMEQPEQDFQPDFTGYEYVVGRQLHPENPLPFLLALQSTSVKPGIILPVTEGLIPTLKNLLRISKRSVKVYSPAIPIAIETRAVADEMEEDADKYAFYGGEDFEFLFTLPDHVVPQLETEYHGFSVIGEVTKEDAELEDHGEGPVVVLYTGEGDRIIIEAEGNKRP